MSAAAYGSSTATRHRSSQAELSVLQDAIYAACELENPITLRGAFYRVVSMGGIEKTQDGYRKVQRELLKMRRNGTLPYHWITDGTRWVFRPQTFDSVDDLLKDASRSYRRALWSDSPAEVHVYSEKDAITSVVQPVTDEYDVPLGIVRGYGSETFAWSVAESVRRNGKKHTYLYQLGDHDPSGVDAWRAFKGRIVEFLGAHESPRWETYADELRDALRDPGEPEPEKYTYVSGSKPLAIRHVYFDRLAVTPEQIIDLDLPTRPTKRAEHGKKGDSRAHGFDGDSIEVDAIPPTELRRIVEEAILRHVDQRALEVLRETERTERRLLRELSGAA